MVTANQEENETMLGIANGLKRVLKLADKQDYVLKNFDKETLVCKIVRNNGRIQSQHRRIAIAS